MANEFLVENKTFPSFVQEAIMKHGTQHEPVARSKYYEILKLKLKRDISIRETGIVMQPLLFWLAASPDGMVYDRNFDNTPRLIEIKCPYLY